MKKQVITMLMAGILAGSTMQGVFAEESILIAPAPTDDITVIAPAPTESEDIVGVPEITVDGEKLDLSKLNVSQYMYTENENTLVPLRVIAEKMGYTVLWDDKEKEVKVGNDEWEVVFNIGVDSYYGVTKIKDAVGMTGPQSYGVLPKLADNTTYVPAKMFELMGYEFSSVGQFASFTKAGTKEDNVQLPNPIKEYNTLDEAKKAVVFKALVPGAMPEGYTLSWVSTINDELFQISYKNGDNEILYRTAEGTEDISGDCNVYDVCETENINSNEVTLKGDGKTVYTAVWSEDESAYSLNSQKGLSKDTFIEIIKNTDYTENTSQE